jgi:hypothetical protein
VSTRHALVFNVLTALVLCHGPIVATAGVITFDETTGGSGLNNNQSVGWQFNVLSPITILDLEWYDPSRTGLSTAHTVGVWSPTGSLLTSALIPAGASVSWMTCSEASKLAPSRCLQATATSLAERTSQTIPIAWPVAAAGAVMVHWFSSLSPAYHL